jgi:site-specific DNA-cytosine methylase
MLPEALTMNVLSCFDGISAGQLALQRAGIRVDNYYASEIDKYAIQITQKNFPNTTQLGDINNWKEWKLPQIDLLIGGSPCQGFSNAGAGLNFDDPRSKLFFVFVDILKHYQPRYFLLENVSMKQEWENVISRYMGTKPIRLNSSLVSAQNRKRLYWTNIRNIRPPKDRNIYLKDIIDGNSEPIIVHNIYGGFGETKPIVFVDKLPTIRTAAGGGHIPSVIKINNIYPKNGQNGNIYDVDGKSPSLMSGTGIIGRGIGSSNSPKIAIEKDNWRKMSVIECERLQTLPDNYTEGVSDTQRYKCIGNSWTVDIVAHIFSYIKP